jgi:hypothetical protein
MLVSPSAAGVEADWQPTTLAAKHTRTVTLMSLSFAEKTAPGFLIIIPNDTLGTYAVGIQFPQLRKS